MVLTPETLPRHELVGLAVEVVGAANADAVGISGRIVAETTRTLGIEGADRVWHVPKDGATFEFDLGRSPAETDERVRVAGTKLESRPARRTENTGDSTWR
ncbi:MAG: ribonuclease P protein component 1 [Haloarculaceae archaeon]